MNPAVYQFCKISITRTRIEPAGFLKPKYLVELMFSAEGRPFVLRGVHLSDQAHQLISAVSVTGLSVEALVDNSWEATVTDNAKLLVTGVELADGARVCTIPPTMRLGRRVGLAVGASACIAAVFCSVIAGGGLLSALALVAGSHLMRSAAAIPSEAFPGMSAADGSLPPPAVLAGS